MASAKLSFVFQEIKGKLGNTVCSRSPYGTILKPRVKSNDPQTPAQIARRNAIAKCAQAWNALDAQQAQEWIRYAQSISIKDDLTGNTRSAVAYNTFLALNAKLLQIDPNAPIATHPPETQYDGDDIAIDAQLRNDLLLLTPSQTNSHHSMTEILIQPLPTLGRQPYLNKYRSLAFVRFTSTNTIEIPLPQYPNARAIAIAYRYVNKDTGQQTQLEPLTILIE
jgi:hypothetical protein